MMKPLKRLVALAVLLAAGWVLPGCGADQDDPGKVTITIDTEKIEQGAEKAQKETGEALERLGEELQEGSQEGPADAAEE